MFLNKTINLNELPEQTNYGSVPSGEYTVTIKSVDVKQTKAGNGTYLKLRLDITGPSHAGRVLFANVTLNNPNEQAEEIGRRQIGDIMRALRISALSDTDQLIGGNLRVKVVATQSEQYGDGNEVKAFKSLEGSVAPSATLSSSTKAAPAAAVTSTSKAAPPWAKK